MHRYAFCFAVELFYFEESNSPTKANVWNHIHIHMQ